MKRLFLFTLILLTVSGLHAQQEPANYCGTYEQDPWLDTYFQNRSMFQADQSGAIFVPLTIHILGNDEGEGYFPIYKVYESLCTLNDDFAESNIQFYIQEPINYIDRTEWYDHPNFAQGIEMMRQNNVSGTANCYIVANPAGNCGYYAGQGNAIALSKGCTDPTDHTWAHELGHFFSLPHTFVGWEGIRWEFGKTAADYAGDVRREIEKVTGSNCQAAADRFCDTPPDYLSYRWNCNGNYESNEVMIDPDSSEFRSDGSLFMSYSNDACMQRFSFEQMEAMRANLSDRRPELIKDSFPDPDLGMQVPQNAFPKDTAVVNPIDLVVSWDPVDGATHYIVEVSRLANFNFIIARERISATSYVLPELKQGIRYYWRVKAVNRNSFCTPFSDTHVFITSKLTATNELFSNGAWHLAKSSFEAGEPISMVFDVKDALQAQLELVTLEGKVFGQERLTIGPGRSVHQLNTVAHLLPGHYLVRLSSTQGFSVRRFIVVQ